MGQRIGAGLVGLVAGLGLAGGFPCQADLLGQVDTFDLNTSGWGGGASPTHVAGGGPTGAGDGYLELSRVSAFHIATKNTTQWTGDYTAAGISGIAFDANHLLGSDPLAVRLLLIGDGGTWATTAIAPVTSGWNTYSFGIAPEDLTYLSDHTAASATSSGGTTVLADTLASVNALQIRHDTVIPTPPEFHPPHVVGVLGIDNIRAIPEPGTLSLLLAMTTTLAACRRSLP